MEFHLLKTFETVASFMSFNRAAAVLNCTQSTVSAQIKALEEDLGAPVFERLGRCIALTPAGKELLRHSRRLQTYEQEIRASVKKSGVVSGLITLRVPQSTSILHLPSILRRFNAAYPLVGFDITNCGSFQLANEMHSGVIDAAFLLACGLSSPDLVTSIMLAEPLVYVAHPSSDLAKRKKLSIKDLAGHTLLLPKHDCGYRMELTQTLKETHVDVATVIEINSVTALVQCLLAGFGVSLLPQRVVAPELAQGRLKKLDWNEPLATNLYLIYHRDKPLTGAFGAFIKMVEEHFSALRRKQPALPAPCKPHREKGKAVCL
jgi:DNA-binding transcriptional LysR family regulator